MSTVIRDVPEGCMLVSLPRYPKEVLEKADLVYSKGEIIVELDHETYEISEREDYKNLLGKKCKYKLGDGIHKYTELPYEEEMIPVSFYIPRYPYKYPKLEEV